MLFCTTISVLLLSLNKPTIFKNNEFIINSDKRFATRTGPHLQYLNQNKLETQHVVRINTVYNRKEKKGAREEREERGDGKLTPARAVNQNRRCAKTLITANGGGVRC